MIFSVSAVLLNKVLLPNPIVPFKEKMRKEREIKKREKREIKKKSVCH